MCLSPLRRRRRRNRLDPQFFLKSAEFEELDSATQLKKMHYVFRKYDTAGSGFIRPVRSSGRSLVARTMWPDCESSYRNNSACWHMTWA